MKYSKEFKLECIRKRKKGIYIATPPGFRERDCFLSQVRDWTRIYDSLGEAGFEHGRPTLDIDQRLELIRRVEKGNPTSLRLSLPVLATIFSSNGIRSIWKMA